MSTYLKINIGTDFHPRFHPNCLLDYGRLIHFYAPGCLLACLHPFGSHQFRTRFKVLPQAILIPIIAYVYPITYRKKSRIANKFIVIDQFD